MGKLVVVVGGFYGSEGKGAVTGWLAQQERDLLAIRVAGSNAGHTVIDKQGRTWKLRHTPVAAVTNPASRLALAAGSEIDQEVLKQEFDALEESGISVRDRLLVDSQATIVDPLHHKAESHGLVQRIGSTGKGIGAARADRIMRQAKLYGGEDNVASSAIRHLTRGGTVIIEGTQGYGLGLHAGFYPYCTSSDCRAVDFCAMAGISPWDRSVNAFEVWVVYRSHPIRVAGNSGPMLGETDWEEIGQAPERTTVTDKIRRVGQWDTDLAKAALRANGGPGPNTKVALTFLDYVVPSVHGATSWTQLPHDAWMYLNQRRSELGQKVAAVGTSPNTMISIEQAGDMT